MRLSKKVIFFNFWSTVKGRYFRTKRFLPRNLVCERRWMAAIHKYHWGSENAAALLAKIQKKVQFLEATKCLAQMLISTFFKKISRSVSKEVRAE